MAAREFNYLWSKTEELSLDNINSYATRLNFAIEHWDMDYILVEGKIKPNFMQRKALKELNRYRSIGESKALVISAAGSGKTYLAAFDALNFNPKRLLYVVHEGSILKKSLETFQEVFGNTVSLGIFNGENKDLDADFVFATNLSISRSLELFDKEYFDYIIIDECHHVAAETYMKIINYFKPEFLLGLTATPERMDNKDIFEIFSKNVPYELRLRDAIINDLVVPFKYYGIRDKLIDYGLNKQQERKMIAQIVAEENCDFIQEAIEAHRPVGKLKAIAFCRNVTHARMMSEAMGEKYHTAFLTGSNNVGERIRAYNDLQSDDAELEILFTVDILNEGVDIPGINMVIFLRPTESSTIFIQQLGRGLRKFPGKEYVTVLDFIGNSYKRSVQIIFALTSLSENFVIEKRLMKSLVKDNFEALGLKNYGVSINIDDLSKEEIINFLENENFNRLNYLKQDYYNFKKYINSELPPKHVDFLNNDCAPNLLRFLHTKINSKKNSSYYNFLVGIGEDNIPNFTEKEINFINYLSDMLPLLRPYEYVIVEKLIHKNKCDINEMFDIMKNENFCSENEFHHAVQFMLKSGFVLLRDNLLEISLSIGKELRTYINDLIEYGLTEYNSAYRDVKDFKLWGDYRIDQVQLKLCKNPQYTMKGTYIYDGIVYIFASIKKDDSIEEHLKYKDKFLEPKLFQWECEAGLTEAAQQELINSKRAYLFIRKVESENGIVLPFTYVGTGKLTDPRKTDNPKNTLLFNITMDNALPDYLQYDFDLNSNI